jgi:hypothetical protein
MNKKLFEEIFGDDYTITDYQVTSLKDLEDVLFKQHQFLSQKLYTFDGDGSALSYIFQDKSDLEIIGLYNLIADYNCNGYFILQHKAISYNNLLNQRLKFILDSEEKKDFLIKELAEIEKEFHLNEYNEILTPDNYFNEIRTKRFLIDLWNRHKRAHRSEYMNFLKNYHKSSYDIEELTGCEYIHEGFEGLMIILQKFTVINNKISFLNGKKGPIENEIPVNKYPHIFSSIQANEMFNYIITTEERKIGRAYVSKYFQLFIDENLIKKKAKPANFLRFLKSVHNLEFKKLDHRTAYSEVEIDNLKALEKKFKNKIQDKQL